MKRATPPSARLDAVLAALLQYGTCLASAVLLVGSALASWPIVRCGIGLFILLPALRVCAMCIFFFRTRDRLAAVAMLVLLVMGSGVALGCHQDRNSEAMGVAGGPPGAPHWALPPADDPMVFEGKSLTALCEQLKDPEHNGHRSLEQLLTHVSEDPLVLWGWQPGGKRTTPPVRHADFVAAFRTWVSNGACP